MFGVSGIAIKIALLLGVVGAAGGAWFYVQSLRAELDAASVRTARAMDVVNEQAITMKKLQKDMKLMQEVTTKLNTKMQKAEESVTSLNNKFDKRRNIANEAVLNPAKIQKTINRATLHALRCNELVTGAEPLPDETNSQCPELVPGKYVKPIKETSSDIRSSIK